jgi:hypothetical protein
LDADAEVLRALVVPDGQLDDPDVALSPDLPDLELCLRRILATPFPEVLDPLEALTGLRELQHRVLPIHRVGALGISGVLELLLEHPPDRRRVHAGAG